jgi:hypothetical protein
VTTIADKIKRLAHVAPDLAAALLPEPTGLQVDEALLKALDRARGLPAAPPAPAPAPPTALDDSMLQEMELKYRRLLDGAPDLAGRLPAEATMADIEAALGIMESRTETPAAASPRPSDGLATVTADGGARLRIENWHPSTQGPLALVIEHTQGPGGWSVVRVPLDGERARVLHQLLDVATNRQVFREDLTVRLAGRGFALPVVMKATTWFPSDGSIRSTPVTETAPASPSAPSPPAPAAPAPVFNITMPVTMPTPAVHLVEAPASAPAGPLEVRIVDQPATEQTIERERGPSGKEQITKTVTRPVKKG